MIQASSFTLAQMIFQAVELLRVPDIQRFGVPNSLLIDLAHGSVLDWFARAVPAVRELYRQKTPVTGRGTGSNFYAVGGFSYAAASRQVSYASASFTSAYLGCSVILGSTGLNIYTGTITGIVSSTVAVISGTELPPSDITGGAAVFLAVWGRSQDIALGALNLAEITMDKGVPTNMSLESDLLGDVPFITNESFRDVTGQAASYPNGVFATLYADTIGVFQGSSVASIGNLGLVAIVNPNKQSSLTGAPYVPDMYVPAVVAILAQRIGIIVGKQYPPAEPAIDADVRAFGVLKEDTK